MHAVAIRVEVIERIYRYKSHTYFLYQFRSYVFQRPFYQAAACAFGSAIGSEQADFDGGQGAVLQAFAGEGRLFQFQLIG